MNVSPIRYNSEPSFKLNLGKWEGVPLTKAMCKDLQARLRKMQPDKTINCVLNRQQRPTIDLMQMQVPGKPRIEEFADYALTVEILPSKAGQTPLATESITSTFTENCNGTVDSILMAIQTGFERHP